MKKIIELQLENEKARFATYLAEERQDMIAGIVLERMQRDIKKLQEKYDKTTRHASIKHTNTHGLISNVREIVYRLRYHKNRWYSKLFEIFTSKTPQEKGFNK